MRASVMILALAISTPGLASSDTAAPAQPGAAKDKVICRREVPIGSLIATRKICLTKTEWQKRADDGNATARQLVEDGAGACGQNGGDCPF